MNLPDLSLIENLWRDMKKEIRLIRPKDKLQLKAALDHEWAHIATENNCIDQI